MGHKYVEMLSSTVTSWCDLGVELYIYEVVDSTDFTYANGDVTSDIWFYSSAGCGVV